MKQKGTKARSRAATKATTPGRDGSRAPVGLDRFDLYELCVQSPAYDARMLEAIHGGRPRVLGEDFCGTAALSRAWVDLGPDRRAIAVDRDPIVIERALIGNAQRVPADPRRRDTPRPRIDYLLADVRDADDRADILGLLNYAICEIHTRPDLVAYLAHARRRLRTTGRTRGCLICDVYTGNDAFLPGETSRTFDHPAGHEVVYTWEQREADPLTGMVENAIHFQVRPPKAKGRKRGKVEAAVHRDAFHYHWRLWSIPELREAMLEAGFTSTQVFPRSAEAITDDDRFIVEPLLNPDELADSFSCYVVGRA